MKELSLVELVELTQHVDEATALRRVRNAVLEVKTVRYRIPEDENGNRSFKRLSDCEIVTVPSQYSAVIVSGFEDEFEEMVTAFEILNPNLIKLDENN